MRLGASAGNENRRKDCEQKEKSAPHHVAEHVLGRQVERSEVDRFFVFVSNPVTN
jgi:hypothetical protein